jgi:hypothetical protein
MSHSTTDRQGRTAGQKPDIVRHVRQGNPDREPDIMGVSPVGRAPACPVCLEPEFCPCPASEKWRQLSGFSFSARNRLVGRQWVGARSQWPGTWNLTSAGAAIVLGPCLTVAIRPTADRSVPTRLSSTIG